MEYTILVSYKGKHLFETQPRSTPTYADAIYLYKILCKCFPSIDGYCVAIFKSLTTTERVRISEDELKQY